jgi:Ca2+-binding RTX toxin-like protein
MIMSDNTLATAQNLGLLSPISTIINDFVGLSDLNDYFKFNLDSFSNFFLNIKGGNYGLELSQDRNNNGIIESGETLLVSTPNGLTTNYSSSLGLSISNININGNETKQITINGTLDLGSYYVHLYSDGANTNYTLNLSSESQTNDPSPTNTDQVLNGTENGDNLNGGDGNDTLNGYGSGDNLNGNGGNDILNGGTGNDNLNGGSGNDILNGGTGNDNINGGSGYDTAIFSGNRNSYTIDLINGIITGTDGSDLFTDIERLQFSDQIIDLVPANQISGNLWHDLNANGIKDQGELGLSGRTIYLDLNNNNQFDITEKSVSTDLNGNYQFTNLSAGSYTIKEVLPLNWQQSNPNTGSYTVTINNGNTISNLDFGNYQNGQISGSVWNDINRNGIKDLGELGIANRQIYLDQNQNHQLDLDELSTTTDLNGNYTLSNLKPQIYHVAENLPSGWEQTYPNTGGTSSQFKIDLRFLDNNLTSSQKAIFTQVANRWQEIITGDLPDVITEIGLVDDIAIDITAPFIDGAGNGKNILGQGGPSLLRTGSFLPSRGTMEFDSYDIGVLESNGQLNEVILHEMGHVLGIGTIWQELGLLTGKGTSNPQYIGTKAVTEYNAIFGLNVSSIPVESTGGQGTADAHWRESVLGNELMTGFLNSGIENPLSRITVASLADLGYQVNLNIADTYNPPNDNILAQQTLNTGMSLDIAKAFVTPITQVNQQLSNMYTVTLSSGEQINNLDFGNYQSFNVINGNSSNNILKGTTNADQIKGFEGNDNLSGLAGNDDLDGGMGNDILNGGLGADTLDGGVGIDTASYANATLAVTVNLSTGTGTLGEANGDTLSNIENLTGSKYNDTLIGNSANNTLNGSLGNDILSGGLGNDIYFVDNLGDTVTENQDEGIDQVNSSITHTLGNNLENLTLIGTSAINGTANSLNNTITGNTVNNILMGLDGSDILNGGLGADTLDGGVGIDTASYVNATSAVTVNLNTGTGTLGEANGDTLTNIENLTGSKYNDTLIGNNGNNTLNGGNGVDILNCGSGNDILVGGLGNDILIGGAGIDRFRFNNPNEGFDTIQDFSILDKDQIQISAKGFGGGLITGTLKASQFIAGAGITSATDNVQRFIYNNANGTLFYDADGNGAGLSRQIATLTGLPVLASSNIVVIA